MASFVGEEEPFWEDSKILVPTDKRWSELCDMVKILACLELLVSRNVGLLEEFCIIFSRGVQKELGDAEKSFSRGPLKDTVID